MIYYLTFAAGVLLVLIALVSILRLVVVALGVLFGRP